MVFSPAEIFAGAVAIIGLVLTILNIIDRYSNLKEKANAPIEELNRRVSDLEEKIDKHEMYFAKDDSRISEIEAATKVTLRGMVALLGHAIDGNNDQEMKATRDELNHYLIER